MTTTYHIAVLEELVTEDIEAEITTALDAAEDGLASRVSCRVANVLLVDGVLLASNSYGDSGEVSRGDAGREDPTASLLVLLSTLNLAIHSLTEGIACHDQCSAGVSNGLVTCLVDRLAVDGTRCRVEHPKALTVIDCRIGNLFTRWHRRLVNVTKRVEGRALVRVIFVLDRAKICGEELCSLGNVILGNHLLNWSLDWIWLDCVDAAKSKT